MAHAIVRTGFNVEPLFSSQILWLLFKVASRLEIVTNFNRVAASKHRQLDRYLQALDDTSAGCHPSSNQYR